MIHDQGSTKIFLNGTHDPPRKNHILMKFFWLISIYSLIRFPRCVLPVGVFPVIFFLVIPFFRFICNIDDDTISVSIYIYFRMVVGLLLMPATNIRLKICRQNTNMCVPKVAPEGQTLHMDCPPAWAVSPLQIRWDYGPNSKSYKLLKKTIIRIVGPLLIWDERVSLIDFETNNFSYILELSERNPNHY